MYLQMTYIPDDSFLLGYDYAALCGRIPTFPFKSTCPTKFRSEIHRLFLAFPIFSSSPTRCTFPDFAILIISLRGVRTIHRLLPMKCPNLIHFSLLPYLQLCSWALSSVLCGSFSSQQIRCFTYRRQNLYILNLFLNFQEYIDIFVNCNWADTRWQYTFTHKQ
jgi:hypothetical protein